MWLVVIEMASKEIVHFYLHGKVYGTVLDYVIKEINYFLNSSGLRFFPVCCLNSHIVCMPLVNIESGWSPT